VLDRADLISRASCGQHHQRHDAASLLHPPDDNRDDELPFVYLGWRLAVDAAEIPRPANAGCGHQSARILRRVGKRTSKAEPRRFVAMCCLRHDWGGWPEACAQDLFGLRRPR
jgi:hypothetical protein